MACCWKVVVGAVASTKVSAESTPVAKTCSRSFRSATEDNKNHASDTKKEKNRYRRDKYGRRHFQRTTDFVVAHKIAQDEEANDGGNNQTNNENGVILHLGREYIKLTIQR